MRPPAKDPSWWGERARRLDREARYAEAEATLREGLTHHRGHPILGYALAVLLLARGAYAEAWPLYEHRRAMPGGPGMPRFSFPEWTGGPIGSLLVLPEQGFGDQLMYARYLPVLRARGIRVTLVTPAALARLFTPLADAVLPVDGMISIPACDAWCFIGSLPRLTGEFPTTPYLLAEPSGEGVGLMLRGNPNIVGSLERSLSPAAMAPLLGLGRSLNPDDTGARDFQATADFIRPLARVISVDTSVAHLAAAMGRDTWILLPHRPDWRWGREGATTPWYPTARLFRQPTAGDWGSVVETVAVEHRRHSG
jgi:hypothetical protein